MRDNNSQTLKHNIERILNNKAKKDFEWVSNPCVQELKDVSHFPDTVAETVEPDLLRERQDTRIRTQHTCNEEFVIPVFQNVDQQALW